VQTVVVSRFGGPEVLQPREAPEPQPGPDQVVVDVRVAEVLFLDTQLRAGWGQDYFPMRPPFVPGTGVGGLVGGRRAVARTGDQGGYAERVVVPADEAIDVPDGVELDVALAALHDGVLAQHRLAHARLAPGSRVLVTAAAGSLGHWFVPLATAAGATVVAAAGGPAKVRVARELGAAVAVDYREPGWVRGTGGRFDVVFDGVGGAIGRAALSATASGGRFYAHGAASGDFAPRQTERDIEMIGVEQRIGDGEWRRLIRTGLDLLATGRVRPTVGQRVPLPQAADAHAAIADRSVVGKTVLTIRERSQS